MLTFLIPLSFLIHVACYLSEVAISQISKIWSKFYQQIVNISQITKTPSDAVRIERRILSFFLSTCLAFFPIEER